MTNLTNTMRRAAMTIAVASVAFVASGFAMPTAAEASEAYVTTSLNMRYGPSTDYRTFDVIPYGRTVEVLDCLPRRDWCEVEYRGYTGWVSSRYLEPVNDRRYNYGHANVSVPIFDFFFFITDFERDRRNRYDNRRYDNHWYERQRNQNRGNSHYGRNERGNHHGSNHRGHSNSRYDNDRYNDNDRYGNDHDRDDRYDNDRNHSRTVFGNDGNQYSH